MKIIRNVRASALKLIDIMNNDIPKTFYRDFKLHIAIISTLRILNQSHGLAAILMNKQTLEYALTQGYNK